MGAGSTVEKSTATAVEAIIEINGLPNDGALLAGQSLRVPVLRRALSPQIAER